MADCCSLELSFCPANQDAKYEPSLPRLALLSRLLYWSLCCSRVMFVVRIIKVTASLSWRVPGCNELNAAESKRHLNLQRQISGARQARQPTPVRGKRKGGTPSSILGSPVPGGTNLFHRLGVGRPSPEQSSRL